MLKDKYSDIYEELDFNDIITRDTIPDWYYDYYESKFLDCDNFLTMDISDDNREEYESMLGKLLIDFTTFSYLNFKIDGSMVQLRDYQDLIINDPHRFKYFRASNQIGKSITLDIKAARNLLVDHGKAHNEAIVSKSLPQSNFQMRRIKGILNSMPNINWHEVKGTADSMSVISVDIYDETDTSYVKEDRPQRIKYSNLLVCAPCTEGLLGYDLHELNLDEFEFWGVDLKYFFDQIAQPRTYNTKGNITIFSNPNGKDNYGAELESQLMRDGKTRKWHVYCFNYLDNPNNTVEEYEELKHELDRREFESTVAAIRSESDRNFLSSDEVEDSYDPNLDINKMIGKQPFFFLDIGSKHDQSCLIGGYVEIEESTVQKKPLVHVYIPIIHLYPSGYPLSLVVGSEDSSSSNERWHYEKPVKRYLEEWSFDGIVPTFGYDITGNAGMKPLFESVGIHDAVDITFSAPVKSGMYQRFKYMMEKRLVHRIKHKQWERQAKDLVVKRSARGHLLINSEGAGNNALKRIPDDTMDATAGFIRLVDNPDIVTPGLTYLG